MAVEEPIGIWEAPGVFRSLALRHFGFLVDLGYSVTDESATPFVVFESATHEVRVYYDAERHHELDVHILGPGFTRGLGIDALLRAANLPFAPADDAAAQMPSTKASLDAALARRGAEVRRLLSRVQAEDLE